MPYQKLISTPQRDLYAVEGTFELAAYIKSIKFLDCCRVEKERKYNNRSDIRVLALAAIEHEELYGSTVTHFENFKSSPLRFYYISNLFDNNNVQLRKIHIQAAHVH